MSSLPVQNIFKSLREAGLSLSLASNSGISVTPARRLTDDLRTLIRDNKPSLLDWLTAANDPAPEPAPAPAPAPAPPADPNAWRELAEAYNAHHFDCHACMAAGRGAQYSLRCGAGAALWNAYQDSA